MRDAPENQTELGLNTQAIAARRMVFLGSFGMEKLRRDQTVEIIVLRSAHYDLSQIKAIRSLLNDTTVTGQPIDMVTHLATNMRRLCVV